MKKALVILLLLLFGIFFLNTYHEEYPDEFDSIVGGRYIAEGKIIYRDWFQHHQPGAYVLAALLYSFSGQSFVKFRVFLAVAFFVINVGGYLLLKRRLGRDPTFYLFFLYFLALGATYFWGQMLLADTLSAYLLVPAYALLFLKDYFREKFERKDLLLATLFAFFAWFTSMTITYAVAGLSAYAIYLFFRSERKRKVTLIKIFKDIVLVVGTPYVIFFVFLLVTGTLPDYYFANVTYNQDYYIYNYPRIPGARFNPIRYAVIIANTFINNYLPALWGVRGIPIDNPLQVTFALSHAVFAMVLILTGQYEFFFPFLISLVFTNARSDPMNIRETDYQAASYILLSIFNGMASLWVLKNLLDGGKLKRSIGSVASFLFTLLGVFWFFSALYLGLKFIHKAYPKYMGTAPLIYDRPEIAPIVNKITAPDDYVWIGPFAFKELFFLKTKKLPSRYHWFLQHAASSKIKDELIADLTARRPKVIVFDRGYAPWGGDPAGFNYFFTDFLDKHYFRTFKLNETLTDHQYRWKIGNPRNFDIDGDFNFDKNRQEEIIGQLIQLGLVEKVAKP